MLPHHHRYTHLPSYKAATRNCSQSEWTKSHPKQTAAETKVLGNTLRHQTALLGLYGQRHYYSQNGGLNKTASNINRQL